MHAFLLEIKSEFTDPDKIIEYFEYFRHGIYFVRRTMKLKEIDCIGIQIFQAAPNKCREIFSIISDRSIRIQTPAGFCCNIELFSPIVL